MFSFQILTRPTMPGFCIGANYGVSICYSAEMVPITKRAFNLLLLDILWCIGDFLKVECFQKQFFPLISPCHMLLRQDIFYVERFRQNNLNFRRCVHMLLCNFCHALPVGMEISDTFGCPAVFGDNTTAPHMWWVSQISCC